MLLNTTAPGRATPSFAAQQTFATGTAVPFRWRSATQRRRPARPRRRELLRRRRTACSVLLNTTAPGATSSSFAAPANFRHRRSIPTPWRWRTSTATAGPTSSSPTRLQHGVGAAEHDGPGRGDALISPPSRPSPPAATPVPWRWGTSTATAGPTSPSPTSRLPTRVGAAQHDGPGASDALLRRPADLRHRHEPHPWRSATSTATAGPTSPSPTPTPARSRCCSTRWRPSPSAVPATGTIQDDDAPTSIAIAAGNNQSAAVNTAFATNLAVDVRNVNNHLVQGVSVTFVAPGSGPSGTFGGSFPVLTNDRGGRQRRHSRPMASPAALCRERDGIGRQHALGQFQPDQHAQRPTVTGTQVNDGSAQRSRVTSLTCDLQHAV